MLRKICIYIVFTTWITSYAYAGSEDWTGTFQVKVINEEYTFDHTPKYVHFLFITAGKCIFLEKDSSINGLKMPESINICIDQNVDDFSKELQKIGSISGTSIELGSTYPKS